MKSELVTTNGAQTSSFGQFKIPQQDINGVCNPLYGARFMEGANS
jgi:hypothetical protein